MFKNYLKIVFRNIKRHKGYSFINIAGLAIGMACFILAGAMALVIALAAVSYQSIKAAVTRPIDALRCE
jgi:chromate transport protein ChrA